MRYLYTYLAMVLVVGASPHCTRQNKLKKQKLSDSLNYTLTEVRNSRYLEYDHEFALFWKNVTRLIKTKDRESIKRISLDSLDICYKIINTDTFLKQCYLEVFNDYVISSLSDSGRVEYYTYLPMGLEEIAPFARQKILKDSNNLKYQEVEILPDANSIQRIRVVFSFIKTAKGYMFYRYYSVTDQGIKKCCR